VDVGVDVGVALGWALVGAEGGTHGAGGRDAQAEEKGVTEDRQDMNEGVRRRKRGKGTERCAGLSWCARRRLYHHLEGN
jgi:hypothetical protein